VFLLSYAAAYGSRDRVPAGSLLRREGHPLGVRRHYEPADDSIEDVAGTSKKWTFGVAAGALLVAGTFAAGALGLNGATLPLGDNAPEHAPSAPGNGPRGEGPSDIGTPAVAAPPHSQHDRPGGVERAADERGTADGRQTGRSGDDARPGEGGAHAAPAPAPAPRPAPAPAPAQQPGPVEKVVTPVTDTVGDVTEPVTKTVGGVLSPVTGTLTGGDQPALTMIDPLGDLLGS
jgi:hypothetical protein